MVWASTSDIKLKKQKVMLCILDGYGIGKDYEFNAVSRSNKPYLDRLFSDYPSSSLVCSGFDVGLPKGTMGNSEVGHLNIGAGRVVYQELTRVTTAPNLLRRLRSRRRRPATCWPWRPRTRRSGCNCSLPAA